MASIWFRFCDVYVKENDELFNLTPALSKSNQKQYINIEQYAVDSKNIIHIFRLAKPGCVDVYTQQSPTRNSATNCIYNSHRHVTLLQIVYTTVTDT